MILLVLFYSRISRSQSHLVVANVEHVTDVHMVSNNVVTGRQNAA